jgi:hypothetical protein
MSWPPSGEFPPISGQPAGRNAPGRTRATDVTGLPEYCASCCAREADWLNRRHHRQSKRKGTRMRTRTCASNLLPALAIRRAMNKPLPWCPGICSTHQPTRRIIIGNGSRGLLPSGRRITQDGSTFCPPLPGRRHTQPLAHRLGRRRSGAAFPATLGTGLQGRECCPGTPDLWAAQHGQRALARSCEPKPRCQNQAMLLFFPPPSYKIKFRPWLFLDTSPK